MNISKLKPGTRVRIKGSPFVWIVSENHGNYLTLVATAEVELDDIDRLEIVK